MVSNIPMLIKVVTGLKKYFSNFSKHNKQKTTIAIIPVEHLTYIETNITKAIINIVHILLFFLINC